MPTRGGGAAARGDAVPKHVLSEAGTVAVPGGTDDAGGVSGIVGSLFCFNVLKFCSGPQVRRVLLVVLREFFLPHLVGFRSNDAYGDVPDHHVPFRHENGAEVCVDLTFDCRAGLSKASA